MSANDGGPAFPVLELDQISGQVYQQHLGMTLRDWFAGMALSGMDQENVQPSHSAEWAYAAADAMLAARERKEPT